MSLNLHKVEILIESYKNITELTTKKKGMVINYMILLNSKAIMPLQPYIVLMSDNYKSIEFSQFGISHFYEFNVREDSQKHFEAVPDGSIDLLFNIGENEVHTYLSGTVFNLKRWVVGENNTCFGVRFQPGKGVLPKEITMDMIVDKDLEIDGRIYGEDLPEKIAQADGIKTRMKIFCESYLKLVENNTNHNYQDNLNIYVRDRISELRGNIAIEKLSEETGYSACYIRRIFKQSNGISPKQFAQYIRFQNLLNILSDGNERYDDIAMYCGYYDEPHMMKEFKKYTGVTPEQYNNMIGNKLKSRGSSE